ncbi:hypothetical protein ILUMI_14511, partial [Ignelater luminosus]
YDLLESERILAKLASDFCGLPKGLRHVKTLQHMAGDGNERNTKQTAKPSQGTV